MGGGGGEMGVGVGGGGVSEQSRVSKCTPATDLPVLQTASPPRAAQPCPAPPDTDSSHSAQQVFNGLITLPFYPLLP